MTDVKIINQLNNYKILEYHLPYFINKLTCPIDSKSSSFRAVIQNIKHFKIKIDTVIRLSLKKDKKINFAFLYGSINKTTNEFEMKYYCIGPNLTSCDGEYRKKFLDNTSFVLYENYLYFTYLIELLFTNRLMTEYFELEFECLPYNDIKKDEIIKIAKKLYTILFLLDMFKLQKKEVENHINKSYYKTLYNVKDLELFKTIVKNERKLIEQFEKEFNDAEFYLQIGQKQLPSSNKHFVNYENKLVNFIKCIKLEKVGKEIYFSYLLNELVINNIYPGFPIISDYFITESNINFFNNNSMVDKIKEDLLNKKNKKHLNKFINYKKTVTYISEYIGRTVKDGIYLQKDELNRIECGDILNDHGVFYKYVFEALYGLSCMNTYAGLIHTDLHINNATFYPLHHPYFDMAPYTYIANGHIMYNIATSPIKIKQTPVSETKSFFNNENIFIDKDECKANTEQMRDAQRFIFPYCGAHFGIIDFSRGYLHRKRLMSDESLNLVTRKNLLMIQNLRITKLFSNLFSNLKVNDFNYFLNTDNTGMYEYLFDTICAFDAYYFFLQYHIYLKDFFKDPSTVKEYESFTNHKLAGRPDLRISLDEKLNLLKDISDKAFKYMDERLQKLDVSKPQEFENYTSTNFAKQTILSGIFDRYNEKNLKPSMVIHNLSYDMLKNENMTFNKETMDADEKVYRNYYMDGTEPPPPFILTIEEKKRREAEAAKMAVEKKEYYEKLAIDFNNEIEKARALADAKLKGTYTHGSTHNTTEEMDKYIDLLNYHFERFIKQQEYGAYDYTKAIELMKARIDSFDRNKYILQTATNFALNDIYQSFKKGGSVRQDIDIILSHQNNEGIPIVNKYLTNSLTNEQRENIKRVIEDFMDDGNIVESDEDKKRIEAIIHAVLGGDIDADRFKEDPDRFIFIEVKDDHNLATYKIKEITEKMKHADVEKDSRDIFIIKTPEQIQQDEEMIKARNKDDEFIINKIIEHTNKHESIGIMMGPKLALYNKGLKLKNKYFADNYKYAMVDPETKELIPYGDMRQKILPGYHTNNIMKANWNFRITSIINEQNHCVNDLGLLTGRFSDDTYRNKMVHPILLKYLDETLDKYKFNEDMVKQILLEDAADDYDEGDDDPIPLSDLLTK